MYDVSTESMDSYFEKKFSFEKQDDWILPPISFLYQENVWILESMKQMKSDLNETKSLLNDKGEYWQQHTAFINKAGFVIDFVKTVIHPEILTQAWCKFYEILSNYSIVPAENANFTSVHLCEAPGGFISALNYHLYSHNPEISWNWIANTLNPYYEGHNIKNVIVDDRLLFPTMRNWYFGEDDTGDVNDPEYIKDFILFLESKGPISLITADGSVSCIDNPAEQELVTSELQFSEMLIAVHSLSPGGNFVLKQFTSFECITICKMYFLNCLFEKVHVFKPFTSKAGNSEVYIICLGYLGSQNIKSHLFQLFQQCVSRSANDKALFPLSSIPESFISQMETCSKYFLTFQRDAIEENLKLYSSQRSSYEDKLNDIKERCAEFYLRKCGIVSDDNYYFAHLFSAKKQIKTSFYDKQNRNCKSMYFQAVGETFENLSKTKAMIWQENVMDVDKRLHMCFPISQKRTQKDIEWHSVWKDIIKRMKSKSYANWISVGKKVDVIENSKFCSPLLIHLWNKISHNIQVQWENHATKSCCGWDMDDIFLLLKEKYRSEFGIVSVLEYETCNTDDPLWLHLKESFNNASIHYLSAGNDYRNLTKNNLFYINTTCWVNSLHQESIIKNRLTITLRHIIKGMNKGDFLMICIQSLLMRFTVGLIFILLSLFEKFFCLLPNSVAPAGCGQLWIFKNFQNPEWTERVVRYLEVVSKFELLETKEILQIVPISSLCGGSYYEFLLSTNNDHMVQRLRSLTFCEKNRIK